MKSLIILLSSILFTFVVTAQNLDLIWQSHDLGEYIGSAGYALGDFDGNGKPELLLATTMKSWANDPRGEQIMVLEHVSDNTYSVTDRVRRDTGSLIITFVSLDELGIAATQDDTFEVYDLRTREPLISPQPYVGASGALFIASTDLNVDDVLLALFTVDSKIVAINVDISGPAVYLKEYVDMPTGKAVLGSFTGPNLKQVAYANGRIFQYDQPTDSFTEVQGFTSVLTTDNFLVSIDIDLDGVDEIVAYQFSTDGPINCFSALTYTIVWSYTQGFYLMVDTLDVFDVNSDGRMDVVYGDDQFGSVWALDALTGVPFWNIDNALGGVSRVVVGDMDGDGVNEICWGSGQQSSGQDQLFIVTSEAGVIWESTDMDPPYDKMVFDDMAPDLTLIYATGGSNSYYDGGVVTAVDVLSNEEIWSFRLESYNPLPCMEIGNVFGNGSVIVMGEAWLRTQVTFREASTGTLITAINLNDDDGPINNLIMLDLDSNGIPDILVVANNRINVIDLSTLSVIQSSPELGEDFVQLAVATDSITGQDMVYGLTVSGDIWKYNTNNNHIIQQPLINPLPTSISTLMLNGEKVLAYGTAGGAVSVLDDVTVAPIVVGSGNVTHLVESTEGRLLFSCGDGFGLLDVAAGSIVFKEQLSPSDDGPGKVVVTATEDGRNFVAWGNDVSAKVMELFMEKHV